MTKLIRNYKKWGIPSPHIHTNMLNVEASQTCLTFLHKQLNKIQGIKHYKSKSVTVHCQVYLHARHICSKGNHSTSEYNSHTK